MEKGNTFDTYHTYEIDWKPDSITWSIDGKLLRTVQKKETFNTTTNRFHYPQTPARVQLSLWPAGSPANGEGTITWAGGLVEWDSEDVKANGYYYAMFKEVTVECYKPPSGANITGSKSYIYTSPDGLEKSVATTDDRTTLKSLLATGTDMDKDYPKPEPKPESKETDKPKPSDKSSDKTSSSASPTPTKEVATIPGLTGAGPGTNGQRGGSGSSGSTGNNGANTSGSSSPSGSSGSGNSGSSGSDSDSSTGSTTNSETSTGSTSDGTSSSDGSGTTDDGGFSQGTTTSSTNSNTAARKGEGALQGSMFAILVAIMGMLIM